MPLNPDELHLMLALCGKQALPQVAVLNGLLVGCFPPALFPAVNPVLVKGVDDVLRIGMDLGLAGAVERLERHDNGHELHAVVGSLGVATRKLGGEGLAGGVGVLEHGAVAAASRIGPSRAVGIDDDLHMVPFVGYVSCE